MAIRGNWTALLLGGAVLASTGCATVISPGPDRVMVTSRPAGATVFVDGRNFGPTPCEVMIPRDAEGLVRFEMKGYETKTVDRDKVLNGWFFPGNLLWVFIWPAVPIAMTVDLIGSNQGKYSTDPIDVELVPIAAIGAADGAARPKARRAARRIDPELVEE